MTESDIFVSNDIAMDVNFGEVFVVDQGVVYKVIASKYSNTATYVVGAYVLHLEKLYRCITAIEEPEEFNAEKWTQVLLANEVQIANANIALKANVDDVYDKTAIDDKVSDINAVIALKANSADVYAKTETYNQTEVDNALATKADADTTYSKTEVDDALALKADVATTYNKTEVDNALATKADAATTYTKTEVDTALSTKADSSSVYSKSDTDTLLAAKADVATTYTKTEVDTALANKANSADVYTKTETYSKTEVDTDIYKKTETYNKSEVDRLISNLPAPMVMKGTLGTGGTITELPTASSENEGFTYKVITEGTYASIPAKVGDMFTSANPVGSSGYTWVHIPSGDETFTDTWRGIKVNGTEKLGSSINTGSVDFKNGTNSTVVFDSSDSSIKVDVDGYTQAQVDTKLSAKANSADVYAKNETYSASEIDGKLLNKANTSDVYTKTETYTKTEVNTALSAKANSSEVYKKTETYTKTEVNSALNLKADKSDTYTKEEVDDKFEDIEPIGTATGNPCSFETDIATSLVGLSADIVASGGNGTPDSPIPIVGYSDVNLKRCGINQFDEQTETGYYDSSTGEKKSLASEIRSTNLIPVIPNTTYAKVGLPAGYSFIFFDSAKNFLSRYILAGSTFTTSANCYYIGINFGARYGNTYNNDVSINYPATSTDYHPYNGQTITLSLGQTVYGGRLYFENGWKCDVTHNIVDMGNLNWVYSTRGYFYATPYPDSIKPNIDNNTTPNMLCSVAQTDTPNHVYSGSSDNIITCTATTPSSIWLRDNSYTDVATFKTAMTGQKIAYELATPFTIDLSSSDMLDAVVGQNNVFSDCGGDVEVEYLKNADMAEFVETIHNSLSPIILTGTLNVGETSITFSDSSITTDSTIDFYTDKFGVNPTDVTVTTGQIVLTFEAQASNLGVKVRVS